MLIPNLCLFKTPVGITELILITDLCLFKTPVGVTELILIQNLYLTNLFSVEIPGGVTELILILRSLHWFGGTRRYQRDYGTCTGIEELILIRKYL